MRGMSHDGKGNYICHDCGHTWSGGERWLLYPVGIKFSKNFSFGVHGVETEADGSERRNFKTVISLGWLRIVLGAGYRSKVKWSVQHQCWMRRNEFADVEEKIDDYLEKLTQ